MPILAIGGPSRNPVATDEPVGRNIRSKARIELERALDRRKDGCASNFDSGRGNGDVRLQLHRHEHIYRSSDFSTVAIKSYLDTLIDNIRAGADAKIQVVEEIEDLSVDKDVATPLGLILNEVLSNAFKHAFPDGRAGTITVQLARGDDGRGRLIVADNGVGFDPSLPAKGIGQKLIKAFAGQLGGVVETTSGGTGSRFAMAFPLAK